VSRRGDSFVWRGKRRRSGVAGVVVADEPVRRGGRPPGCQLELDGATIAWLREQAAAHDCSVSAVLESLIPRDGAP